MKIEKAVNRTYGETYEKTQKIYEKTIVRQNSEKKTEKKFG